MGYCHYGLNDMAYGNELNKLIVDLKKGIDSGSSKTEVILNKITAVEFLNDYPLFNDAEKHLIDPFVKTIKAFTKDINCYFQSATTNDVLTDLRYDSESIDFQSKYDYFSAFVAATKKNGFDETLIKTILEENLLPLHFVLQNKDVVQALGKFFHDYLLSQPDSLELFISEKEIKRDTSVRMYFPEFTTYEINQWISSYLGCGGCNANYLRCLILHRQGLYEIYPQTLVAIKKHYEGIMESVSKSGSLYSTSVFATIDDDQEEPRKLILKGRTASYSFSGKWIKENQDYPTLMNNLIYVFDLVDKQFRIDPVYNPNNDGAIYSALVTRQQDEYGSELFSTLQMHKQCMFNTYVSYLRDKCKINIEDLFVWFCNEYLPHEFGINGITLNLEPITSYPLFRCRNLFVELEGLFKQYEVFVENNVFTNDLYLATKHSYKFSQYRTNIRDKYYILNEKTDLSTCLFLLFSDQSVLCYIDENIKAKNFFDLISRYRLTVSSFHSFDKPKLDKLLSEGIVEELDGGVLRIANHGVATVCHDLYSIGFLSRRHLGDREKSVALEMVRRGYIQPYSSLLAPAEADVFSYFLNNEKFSNALHLRNAYEHHELDSEPASVHESNYCIGLRLMALAIIKINEDLCIKEYEDKAK